MARVSTKKNLNHHINFFRICVGIVVTPIRSLHANLIIIIFKTNRCIQWHCDSTYLTYCMDMNLLLIYVRIARARRANDIKYLLVKITEKLN